MRKSSGYWMDPANVVAECKKAMEEEGWDALPSAKVLRGQGYGSICDAVRYHGGFHGLRDLLGEDGLIRPMGFWQDPINVVAEAKRIMEKEGWDTLPSKGTLYENGYSSLAGAGRYHGGMSGLRRLLGVKNFELPTQH